MEPDRDARISRRVGHARELVARQKSTMTVEAAREGLEVPLLKAKSS